VFTKKNKIAATITKHREEKIESEKKKQINLSLSRGWVWIGGVADSCIARQEV
jgi:hypothetical protein